MNKSDMQGTKRPRPSVDSAPGILFTRFRENSVVIIEDDETDEHNFETEDLKTDTENDVKDSEKEDEQQKRATVFITGGALSFIIIAALLVTTSFLMSPVIEQIFGKNFENLNTEWLRILNIFKLRPRSF